MRSGTLFLTLNYLFGFGVKVLFLPSFKTTTKGDANSSAREVSKCKSYIVASQTFITTEQQKKESKGNFP